MLGDDVLHDSFFTLKYFGLGPILISRFGNREFQFSNIDLPRTEQRPCIQVVLMQAGWIMVGNPDHLPLGLAETLEDLVIEYVSTMEVQF